MVREDGGGNPASYPITADGEPATHRARAGNTSDLHPSARSGYGRAISR